MVDVLSHLLLLPKFSLEIGQITNVEHPANLSLLAPEESVAKKIYFVGDLMLARNVERRLANTDTTQALLNFASIWSNAYVVANFESAVPSVHSPTPDFAFQFSTKKELLPGLQTAGITHVSLANNHAYDFGLAGYQNTISEMDAIGIAAFGDPYRLGTSSVSIVDTGEATVALIGINLTLGELNFSQLTTLVDDLSKTTDIQLAYIHWGEEYNNNQSEQQRNVAIKLAQMGIDVIIGHHPHVIQGIERIKDTLVFYSLGNFLFDQYFSADVQNGLMLALVIKSDSLQFEVVPVSSLDSRVKPFVLEGQSRQEILNKLATLSDPELNDAILMGALTLQRKLASSTEVVIMTE